MVDDADARIVETFTDGDAAIGGHVVDDQ
jgi:hypothetical protein